MVLVAPDVALVRKLSAQLVFSERIPFPERPSVVARLEKKDMSRFLRIINNLNTCSRIAAERARELLHPIPHSLLARMVTIEVNRGSHVKGLKLPHANVSQIEERPTNDLKGVRPSSLNFGEACSQWKPNEVRFFRLRFGCQP
jgi:hypothetical protein